MIADAERLLRTREPLPIVLRCLGKLYREAARMDLEIARLYEEMARSEKRQSAQEGK